MKTESILLLNASVVGAELLLFAYLLFRKKRFNWTNAGFWSLLSFFLYFVLNPFMTVINKGGFSNIQYYDLILSISGGKNRALWILFVTVVGIAVFFGLYLKIPSRPVDLKISKRSDRITPLMWVVFLVILIFAFYSLVVYRAMLSRSIEGVVIENGRFVGNITGYETSAYLLAFVPASFLILSKSFTRKLVGWLIVVLFIFFALPNGWSRYAIVSMGIVALLSDASTRKYIRPNYFIISAVLLLAAVLQLRGHTEWKLNELSNQFSDLSSEIQSNVENIIGSVDTSMLATFYLESYVSDSISGFDYEITLINYALSGWIPSRIFPEKYFLLDWLHSIQKAPSPTLSRLLYGSKSSLLGSFYSNGGFIGVVLSMVIAAILCRKLDGMISPQSPNLVRALGISWLSILWIVWGSHDYWGFSALGFLSIPVLALWIVTPKLSRKIIQQNTLYPPSNSLKVGTTPSQDS